MISSEFKKIKILCIGDSLALPGHLNKYEDTWISKLKNTHRNCDFITFFKRQLDTNILTHEGGGLKGVDGFPKGADCLEMYMPNVVIIQLGIVDCAPRLLSKFENRFLKYLPKFIQVFYVKGVKKVRKRKISNTFLSIETFKANLKNYFDRCENNHVNAIIYINIPFPDNRMIKANPDIVVNVEKYNECINEFKTSYDNLFTIDVLDARKYDYQIYEDGYHPNSKGHLLIFNAINNIVNEEVWA